MKSAQIKGTVSSVTVASCLLFAVGAAGAESISNTGANSTNVIGTTSECKTTASNNTEVKASNNNPQAAQSGNVSTSNNTTSGQAGSGGSSNSSSTSFGINIVNTSPQNYCGEAAVRPPVTHAATANPRPVGGQGAGQPAPVPTSAPAKTQVVAPTGGVGAGAGGFAAISTLGAASFASGAWAFARIRRQHGSL